MGCAHDINAWLHSTFYSWVYLMILRLQVGSTVPCRCTHLLYTKDLQSQRTMCLLSKNIQNSSKFNDSVMFRLRETLRLKAWFHPPPLLTQGLSRRSRCRKQHSTGGRGPWISNKKMAAKNETNAE